MKKVLAIAISFLSLTVSAFAKSFFTNSTFDFQSNIVDFSTSGINENIKRRSSYKYISSRFESRRYIY